MMCWHLPSDMDVTVTGQHELHEDLSITWQLLYFVFWSAPGMHNTK